MQDAFLKALERWPRDGVPGQPAGAGSRPRRATMRSTACAATGASRQKTSILAGLEALRPPRREPGDTEQTQ